MLPAAIVVSVLAWIAVRPRGWWERGLLSFGMGALVAVALLARAT